MMAMAAIMARLTASAATEMERRGIAPPRLAWARRPSTRSRRAMTAPHDRRKPNSTAGIAMPAPSTTASAASMPKTGSPPTGPWAASQAPAANSANGPATARRGSRARASTSSSPRTAASGVRRAASRAGAVAATSASGRPTANASPTIPGSSGGTLADETIQNWLTVEEVSRTAPCASSQPSGAPSAHPSSASAPASPRNNPTTARRVTPRVRSMPISPRRVMTDTETVL